MSNMIPSTTSYSNTDYMHNLMRMQQQQQRQTTPTDGHADTNGRGGYKRHRDNDERRDGSGHGRGGGGKGGGRGDRGRGGGRGGGGGGGRGGWRGGRGRGRGGRGGGRDGGDSGGDSRGRGDGVMDNPRYDFETGQIDPSYPTKWDSECKLVALMPPHSKATQPTEEKDDSNGEADAKRHRADKAEAVVASSDGDSSGGWRDYKPYIVSTFTFDTTSPPLLRDAAKLSSRIEVPGTPAVWKQPTLPLHIKVSKDKGGQQVNKPPLSVLMHVAKQADCLVDGQPLPHPTAADGTSLTFLAYRNSLRSLLDARKPSWRIDVQRVKGVVLLRRHLDYAWEESEDVGHQFERMCTETTTGGEGERRGWRGLIAGCVGKHMLLTSSEIDAVKRDDSSENTANGTWQLRQLVELKTAWKSLAPAKLKDKLKSYWLQSWLGGVPAIQLGLKSNAAGGSADVVIDELRQVEVASMATDEWKDGCMARLRRMLAWLGETVKEGVVYKLVRERKDGNGEWQVALYEIVGGKDRWPVWTQPQADEAAAATTQAAT